MCYKPSINKLIEININKKIMKSRVFIYGLIFLGLFFYSPSFAATADHLVISQAQTSGGAGKTNNDFIEIYNPAGQDIDLQGMRLVKRTKTAASDTLIKSFTKPAIIKAYGYYLWANSSFTDIATTPDATSTVIIADNNGVALRNGPNNTGAIVDSVAWGEAANAFIESSVFAANPEANQSIERLPGSGQGNGQDTDNNSADFFQQASPHPRNSLSGVEQPQAEESAAEEEEPAPSTSPADSEQTPFGGLTLEISEIMVNPEGADGGNEWVELHNFGGEEEDLSGWIVDDSAEDNALGSSAYKIDEGVAIGAGEYAVIQIPKGRFALNNSGGDAVRIFDPQENIRIKKEYAENAISGYAYARNNQDQWEWTQTPTPGAENSFEAVVVYTDKLRISEVHPNPEGPDEEGEFIEIHNFSEDSLDLAGWIVADSRKKFTISEEDFFDTEVAEDGFFVIYREVSRISLNNSGTESVLLLNPDGDVVSEIEFDAKGKGAMSYSWNGTVYQWTTKETPGFENEIVFPKDAQAGNFAEEEIAGQESDDERANQNQTTDEPEQIEEVPLSEVRQMKQGDFLLTSGVVVVPPGVLEEKVLYLQGSGIRVQLAELPNFIFSVGDLVQFAGEVDSFHNELQLSVSDAQTIKVLDEGLEILPTIAATGDIGENLEGNLVTISGTLSSQQGQTIFIDDGTGEARILIRDSTGITKPDMRKGDYLQITGVVSQFNENYRVLPRFQEDIRFGGVKSAKTLPRTGSNFWLILAVFEGFALILSFLFGLIKGKSLLT